MLFCVGKRKDLRKKDLGRTDTKGEIGLKGLALAQPNGKDQSERDYLSPQFSEEIKQSSRKCCCLSGDNYKQRGTEPDCRNEMKPKRMQADHREKR